MADIHETASGSPKSLSPLNLAFVGDAVFEALVRERLVREGNRPVKELHRLSVSYVCAAAQSRCYEAIEERLTEEERAILRRGRNANAAHSSKSSSVIDYRRATAVEALLGFLHLSGERGRLLELVDIMMQTLEGVPSGEGATDEAGKQGA